MPSSDRGIRTRRRHSPRRLTTPGQLAPPRPRTHERLDVPLASIRCGALRRVHREVRTARYRSGDIEEGEKPSETTGNGGAIRSLNRKRLYGCFDCNPGLCGCPCDRSDHLQHGYLFDVLFWNGDSGAELDGDRRLGQGQVRGDVHVFYSPSGHLSRGCCRDGRNFERNGQIRRRFHLSAREHVHGLQRHRSSEPRWGRDQMDPIAQYATHHSDRNQICQRRCGNSVRRGDHPGRNTDSSDQGPGLVWYAQSAQHGAAGHESASRVVVPVATPPHTPFVITGGTINV